MENGIVMLIILVPEMFYGYKFGSFWRYTYSFGLLSHFLMNQLSHLSQ